MDLLSPYRALIASPEQLASCRQADTVAGLLQRLRSLWSLESASDGQLIGELNRCNQQVVDVDVRRLEGTWFPHRYDAGTRSLSWCLPQGHATEPFLDQYIERCRQRSVFNQLINPRTSAAPLMAAAVVDGPAPAGFILHLSRCGSTLLSGCLAELDDTCVLSESPVLTEALLDASLADGQKRNLLAQLVRLQVAPFPGRGRVVVKWNAWDILQWSLVQAAFPGVPRALLFREPVEILASHARAAGRHMSGDPSLGHLNPVFRDVPADATLLDLRIAVLRELLKAMAALADGERTLPIDYTRLDIHAVQDICRHFALAPGAGEVARMTRRMDFHSKEPGRPFEADGVQKSRWFDPDERERIQRALAPDYRSLLAASRARRR